jgi:hypothetical protein
MEDIHSPANGRSPTAVSRKPRTAGGRGSGGPKRNGRAKALPLHEQLGELLGALRAARRGDFSVRLDFEFERPQGAAADSGVEPAVDRLMGDIAREVNSVVALNEAFVSQMVRVERIVGREGRMNERVSLGESGGGWAESIGAINALIGDLVQPTTEVARVISAVAAGDFTQ